MSTCLPPCSLRDFSAATVQLLETVQLASVEVSECSKLTDGALRGLLCLEGPGQTGGYAWAGRAVEQLAVPSVKCCCTCIQVCTCTRTCLHCAVAVVRHACPLGTDGSLLSRLPHFSAAPASSPAPPAVLNALTSLSLTSVPNASDETMRMLGQRHPALALLSLSGCGALTGAGLSVHGSFAALRCLSVEFCDSLTGCVGCGGWAGAWTQGQ